jgi:hypothetical protein
LSKEKAAVLRTYAQAGRQHFGKKQLTVLYFIKYIFTCNISFRWIKNFSIILKNIIRKTTMKIRVVWKAFKKVV